MPSAAKKSEMAKEPAGKKTNNERRELLSAASKLAAAMAALGLSGTSVLGQASQSLTARERAARDLFQLAIRTGDMQAAILKYGKSAQITDRHVKALNSLTADDLRLLGEIQKKLASAGGRIAQVW